MTSLEHEDGSRGNDSVSDYDYDHWGDNDNWGDMEVRLTMTIIWNKSDICITRRVDKLLVPVEAIAAVEQVTVAILLVLHLDLAEQLGLQMVGIMKSGAV